MESSYKGMTVNERLYVSGLLAEFDKAVKEKDVNRVISILKNVELTESSIVTILMELGLRTKSEE